MHNKSPRDQRRPRTAPAAEWVLAVPAMLILVLAGCSGRANPVLAAATSNPTATGAVTSSPAPTATPVSDPPGTSAPAAPTDPVPRKKASTSAAERARLGNIWADCLHANGVPIAEKGDAKISWKFPVGGKARYPKAWAVCADRKSPAASSRDPKRAAQAADAVQLWVKCINDTSSVMKVVETKDGWALAQNYSPAKATKADFDRVVRGCKIKTSGSG